MSVYLPLVSDMQITSFMHCIILSTVAHLGHPYFSILPHKRHNFWKNAVKQKMYVWEIINAIQERLCKKALCSPRSTANAAAEWELSRIRRTGKMFVICVQWNSITGFCCWKEMNC